MDDNSCIEFLQSVLPGLQMRWEGFRKIRKQVCKRINRRIQVLQLRDIAAYQDHLLRHREEWAVLDALCRVTISRFFRDQRVFTALQSVILPKLVQQMVKRDQTLLRLWSAGCAAGEEPYSLGILWELDVKEHAGSTPAEIEIVATDSDQPSLDRAIEACYPFSSVKNLPEDWRRHVLVEKNGVFCLRPPFRHHVNFICQDIRIESPSGIFDLILCRNLVFTYFGNELQGRVLRRLANALRPEGFLVIGIHETLPEDQCDFTAWSHRLRIYQRRS